MERGLSTAVEASGVSLEQSALLALERFELVVFIRVNSCSLVVKLLFSVPAMNAIYSALSARGHL
jgi:hypothetical protein